MAWVFNENRLGQSLVGSVDAEARVPLGTILRASDPVYGAGEFIYLAGVASTAVGNFVAYSMDDGSTTRSLAWATDGPLAVAMAATVADTWGWYQISGKAVATVAALFDDNGDVYLTATPGVVDDSGSVLIHNARGASAISGSLADIEIARPFVLAT